MLRIEQVSISRTDTYCPCFRRDPVAGQQRNQDTNSSYCLTVDPWKRKRDKTRRSNFQHIKSKEFPSSNLNLSSYENIRRYSKKLVIDIPNPSGKLKKSEPGMDQLLDNVKNVCPFCEKHFDSIKRVKNHVIRAHRKLYKCDKCRRTCDTARAMEEHKLIHRPDYFLECEICHGNYKTEDGLKKHIKHLHRVYDSQCVCEHCGRGYKLKHYLKQHIQRAHMQQPTQVCRFCGKEVADVKSHEWRHQRTDKEAKYEHTCHLCHKKFHIRSKLDNHLRLHEKGFKCEECGKDCRGTRQLACHKWFKHSPRKGSICILCQREFKSISNFHHHVLIHAGIRPYKCDVCKEDFRHRSSLLRHVKRRHVDSLPPMHSNYPQISELVKNYLGNLQNSKIDKSVLNVKP